MKRLFSFTFLLLAFTAANAQLSPRIETDRPDQTETPFLTPKKWFQFEMGINWETDKSGARTFVHPTLLSKYGLSDRFELRLITELVTAETVDPLSGRKTTDGGFRPIQVGGKLRLLEEKGWIPKTSLIFHIGVPKLATPAFQPSQWAPNFRFVMQNKLTEIISLGYNLGAVWTGNDGKPTWLYTLAPGIDFAPNWYAYIEAFGFLNADNHPQHSFDGGIAYNFTPDARIDLSGGFGLTPNTRLDKYVALGFSIRFH
jgi:hypothetical protein